MRKPIFLLLFATLFIAPNFVTVPVRAQNQQFWALIVCGCPRDSWWHPTTFEKDAAYMYHVLSHNYDFDGIYYLSVNTSWTGVDDLATKYNVQSAITEWLESRSDGNDVIFIYFTSHGSGYYKPDKYMDGGRYDESGDEGSETREINILDLDTKEPIDVNGDGDTDDWVGIDEYLQVLGNNPTTEDYYWDDDLASDLSVLQYETLIFVRQGCFSGSIIDDVSATNRIIMTSSNETDVSYGDIDDDGYSEWSEAFIDALYSEDTHWDNGVVHEDPPVFIDADEDNDGHVSMWEAWDYAWNNNTARLLETSWLDDNGNGHPTYINETDVDSPYDDGDLAEDVWLRGEAGGCPYVYTWNGKQYMIDNNLLPASETSNGADVEDYYKLEQLLVPKYRGDRLSFYSLQIREFEQEQSYLDQIRLLAVDHESDVNIAVTANGEIMTYREPLTPISCLDSNGDDKLSQVLLMDGNISDPTTYFYGNEEEYLVLDFGQIDSDNTKLIVRDDIICEKCCIEVQVVGSDGVWQTVATVAPRDHWSIQAVDLSQFAVDNENFTVRLLWTSPHNLDFVGLEIFPNDDYELRYAILVSAIHSVEGNAKRKLLLNDNIYAELVPDQQIELTFLLPNESEEVRTFIIYTEGHYHTIKN